MSVHCGGNMNRDMVINGTKELDDDQHYCVHENCPNEAAFKSGCCEDHQTCRECFFEFGCEDCLCFIFSGSGLSDPRKVAAKCPFFCSVEKPEPVVYNFFHK